MIKAIETEYHGYKFRSRLEARWAVFLDAIGAKWEYEPQGFQLEDNTIYLPDFLIHDVHGRYKGDLWMEVKGKMTDEDYYKIIHFAGRFNKHGDWIRENPILVVGNIPDPGNYDEEICDYVFANRDSRIFTLETIDGDPFPAIPYADYKDGFLLDDGNHNFGPGDEIKTALAYLAARQARFEHGERPNPSKIEWSRVQMIGEKKHDTGRT